MSDEISKTLKRIDRAETVKELYLYPDGSKLKNVACGIVWLGSWFLGVSVQPVTDSRALGGAYLVFAVSMLIEFVEDKRSRPWALVFHGLFLFFMAVMAVVSLCMLYGDEVAIFPFLISPVAYGYIVSGRMVLGSVLSLIGFHKFFYDAEAEARRREAEERLKMEAERKEMRNEFNRNAAGPPKGGDGT